MLIVMAGLPGAGKSAVAEKLRERLGYPMVSVDTIEEAILSAGIDDDQPTGLAAYLVAEALAGEVLAAESSVIVDAVNAVSPARDQWVALAERYGNAITFVEVVCSDPVVLRERLKERHRTLPHANDASWHAVEQSLDEYDEWVGPAAEADRITVDSIEALSSIVDKALIFIEG
jgi:predicted kinase